MMRKTKKAKPSAAAPAEGFERVEFTQDASVKDEHGQTVQEFKAGQRYDLPLASAERWVRRNMAQRVDAAAKG